MLLKHETSFEQVVIEQLKVAGFANRKKGENVNTNAACLMIGEHAAARILG